MAEDNNTKNNIEGSTENNVGNNIENNTKEEVYPSEEQGIEPQETKEEEKLEMETGEKEEDIYKEEGREELTEDSEISPDEEGFMEGAEGKGELGHCASCGKLLDQEADTIVEREFNGKKVWFCSESCAEKGPRKRKEKLV